VVHGHVVSQSMSVEEVRTTVVPLDSARQKVPGRSDILSSSCGHGDRIGSVPLYDAPGVTRVEIFYAWTVYAAALPDARTTATRSTRRHLKGPSAFLRSQMSGRSYSVCVGRYLFALLP
jgi:hypothetical protein